TERFSCSVWRTSDWELRLSFNFERMRGIRLNTYQDSIERDEVQAEPQPAFQGGDRTPQPGPETHNSTPTRYPSTLPTAARDSRGTPGSSFWRTCAWGGHSK